MNSPSFDELARLNMDLLREDYPVLTSHRVVAVWTYNTYYARVSMYDSAARSVCISRPNWCKLTDEVNGFTFYGLCFDLINCEFEDSDAILETAKKIVMRHSKVRRGASVRVYHASDLGYKLCKLWKRIRHRKES